MANLSTDDNYLRTQPNSMMLPTISATQTATTTTATTMVIDGSKTIRGLPRQPPKHNWRHSLITPSPVQAYDTQPTRPAATGTLHRRGGSVSAAFARVSTTATFGATKSPTTSQHHVLRKPLQQQHYQLQTAQERPGLPQTSFNPNPSSHSTSHHNDIPFFQSIATCPFTTGLGDETIRQAIPADFLRHGASLGYPDFNFDPESTPFIDSLANAGGPSWIPEDEAVSARRIPKRISKGTIKLENAPVAMCTAQRPRTAHRRNGSSLSFSTSVLGNDHGFLKREGESCSRPSRFSDEYDESMEETIKPTKSRGYQSRDVFEYLRRQAEYVKPVPTSSSNPASNACTNMGDMSILQSPHSQVSAQVIAFDQHDLDTVKLIERSEASHSEDSQTTAQANRAAFSNPLNLYSNVLKSPTTSPDWSSGERSSRPAGGHRRTDSMASMVSAASIAGIDVDHARIPTGIDTGEVDAFIFGPDMEDGKWWCGWPQCDKRFGRKENIKSHVQTHLNDRQYQCPTCFKCFVRQHDLKRHAKIHTGVKPYLCECGNSFARHDALTRHRQRGMCVGALDGVVRKAVRRGRPRKAPPNMETRDDHRKAARTRRRNNLSISSVSSSFSSACYSDCSTGESPPPCSSADILGDPYHVDLMALGIHVNNGLDMDMDLDIELDMDHDLSEQFVFDRNNSSRGNPDAVLYASSASMPTLPDQMVGPLQSTRSHHAFVSPDELIGPHKSHSGLPRHRVAPIPMPSTAAIFAPCNSTDASPYTTPPGLSQSSSSPTPCGRFLELDPHGQHPDDATLLQQALAATDGGLAMTGKLEDDFDRAFSIFTNDDQVYFSSGTSGFSTSS